MSSLWREGRCCSLTNPSPLLRFYEVMQLSCMLCMRACLSSEYDVTDSCFIGIETTDFLPSHPAAVAAVSVGLAHAPALMMSLVLLFVWLYR